MGTLAALLHKLVRLVDDVVPMPADQREARDWQPIGDDEVARRRRLRLKLHMLEKRGKGGSR